MISVRSSRDCPFDLDFSSRRVLMTFGGSGLMYRSVFPISCGEQDRSVRHARLGSRSSVYDRSTSRCQTV